MNYTRSLLILLSITLTTPLYGQSFSREQALSYALTHNPQLAAMQQQSQAATAERRLVQGARLPQLDINYMVRRSDNPLNVFADKLNTRSVTPSDLNVNTLNEPDPNTLHATQLSLQLPLYTGGQISAQVRGAKAMEQASQQQLQRLRKLVVSQTTQAYMLAQASEHAVSIADDAVRAAQKHANTTARLLRQGRIITSDKLTAEVNLANIKAMREKVYTRHRAVYNQLKRLMGLPLDNEVSVSSWHRDRTAYTPLPLEQLTQQALATRTDLLASQSQAQAAQAQVKVARSGYKPHFSVIANNNWYDDNFGTDNRSWSVMGMASLRLFAGGRTQQQVRMQGHRASEAEDQLRALRLQIQNEVRDAYDSWQSSKERLAITSDHVAKAERTVRLVNQRYGQGRTLLIDLLQAERALVDTRNEALSAALDYETGIVSLQLASGELKPVQ